MGQVKFETAPGVFMTSVMTLDSLDDMKLKVGDPVKAVFKAINVLLVKE
jgi:molybdopterin-binding protein